MTSALNRLRYPLATLSLGLLLGGARLVAAPIAGVIETDGGTPVALARVTVFTPDLSSFWEARSDPLGAYSLEVPDGSYRMGVSASSMEYVEIDLIVVGPATHDFSLGPETEPGRWDVIGSTAPEFLDATDIGFLLPDGTLFYCHDTTDPIRFDPRTGQKTLPSGSASPQGCMNGSLLADGSVLMAGGQDGSDPGSFRNAISWVKTFSPGTGSWVSLSDMLASNGRWYPGLARLADGSFLVMGGGTAPNAARTNTCERFDLQSQTWSYTGSMLNPTEFPPAALLFTGEVLATWWPPQLYDPGTGQWRLTGTFVQPNRLWPGHSDHSIAVLADGRVVALGIVAGPDGNSTMGEVYDPATESWSLTSNPGLLRYQTELVPLPDGRILVAGGETESPNPPVPDVLGLVRWCDLYDPALDTWRRVADMNVFREYHAVSLLLPDGRVATTGGTRIKFQVGPTSADIEAYSPPYLFRGVRPSITGVSNDELERGEAVTLSVAPQTTITSVVLMGTGSTTHWVDGGVPRRLVLQAASMPGSATFVLPSDGNVLPLGHYLLFAMVDDIPSEGVVVRIKAPTGTATQLPNTRTVLRRLASSPNPFNPTTRLEFELALDARITLEIFDVAGRCVRTLLAAEDRRAGIHRVVWDGTDSRRRPLASGAYLAQLSNGAETLTRRLTILK